MKGRKEKDANKAIKDGRLLFYIFDASSFKKPISLGILNSGTGFQRRREVKGERKQERNDSVQSCPEALSRNT